jgi:Dynein attachment factor N-terminus
MQNVCMEVREKAVNCSPVRFVPCMRAKDRRRASMVQAPSQRPPKQCKALENAVYDDWKRTAVDSAKKRAVGQLVDYDTFKNMVSVAHLRPLGDPKRSEGVYDNVWMMLQYVWEVYTAAVGRLRLSARQHAAVQGNQCPQ